MDNQHPSFLGLAVLRSLAIVGVASTLFGALPTLAGTYDLTIGSTTINVSGSDRSALTINGTVPGPTLRFKEGEDLVKNVTNTRSEEHTSELQSLMRISYAVFCLKKKKKQTQNALRTI